MKALSLKELRIRAGLTQVQLAKAVNVTQCTVSAWENGRAFPRMALWKSLENALKCTVNELFEAGRTA